MTESQLVSTFNIIHRLVGGSFVRGSASSNVDYTKEQLKVKISFSELERIWSTTAGDNYQKAEAIVDYLDFYLSAGQLKSLDSPTRNILIETVALAKEKWRYSNIWPGELPRCLSSKIALSVKRLQIVSPPL